MTKISGSDIRPGMVIEHDGSLWAAVKTGAVKPGKGPAYNQVELKNILDGRKLNQRFGSSDRVEETEVERRQFQFLYKQGDRLDNLMTGGGVFKYKNQRGATNFSDDGSASDGYPQPSLIAFDREPFSNIIAGGRDSGVFLSTNGGADWQLLTDPINPSPMRPHLPRPWFGYFSHEAGGGIKIYIGTQGRGVWRVTLPTL